MEKSSKVQVIMLLDNDNVTNRLQDTRSSQIKFYMVCFVALIISWQLWSDDMLVCIHGEFQLAAGIKHYWIITRPCRKILLRLRPEFNGTNPDPTGKGGTTTTVIVSLLPNQHKPLFKKWGLVLSVLIRVVIKRKSKYSAVQNCLY